MSFTCEANYIVVIHCLPSFRFIIDNKGVKKEYDASTLNHIISPEHLLKIIF